MNQTLRPTIRSGQTSAWRLWIDRCGGYRLLVGDHCTVGGARPDGTADVQVRSDWRRMEGTLIRRDGDYFWSVGNAGEHLASLGEALPISGSATLRLRQPSPLSGSAILSLDPPHRFDDHVDQVILVDQTVVIGPSSSDHIRCTAIDTAVVLVFRDGVWKAKLKSNVNRVGLSNAGPKSPLVDLVPDRRVSLGEFDMMLEKA